MADAAVTEVKAPRDGGVNQLLVIGAVLAVSIVVLITVGREQVFPDVFTSRFPFADWVNQAEGWLEANLKWATRAISDGVGWGLGIVEEFLWTVPWAVVVVALVFPALAYGGLRLGLLTLIGVMIWGAFGMWYEAMSTLAMMGIAVLLCIMIGVLVGVACAQSDRVERLVNPVLDTMQVMPAFVYLMPAIFFFGIGQTSATLAIMIYALPPMIRLTNLGIRQVPATMIEAAESFGTTRWQLLIKVQIPQALPSIMLGINQTIMMALALAVLAVFVGGGGLGEEVWKAIVKLKVGWSLEGGLCIVAMAIVFDRLSQAMSDPARPAKLRPDEMRFYLLPQSWERFGPARAVETPIGILWTSCGAAGAGMTNALARLIERAAGAGNGLARWVRAHPFLVIGTLLAVGMLLVESYGGRGWRIGGYPSALEFS
ncbi:MAG: ABC transporter permease subunit, partial [Pseudomonadota bacterium]